MNFYLFSGERGATKLFFFLGGGGEGGGEGGGGGGRGLV